MRIPPPSPTSPAPTEIEEEFSACIISRPLLAIALSAARTIGLPLACTLQGQSRVSVDTVFTVFRLDDHMLYLVIADPTTAARLMGTASQQLFVLPLALTTLRTHNADPTTDDLRADLEHLCIGEVLHWQDPQLEPRLHDPQVQLYHAYMVLSQRSIEDPTLYVFTNVLCTVDRSPTFRAPVAGKLSQPYVTPNMDAVFMRYEYSLNWTHHKASARLTKLADMWVHSVRFKNECQLPHEVCVYDGNSFRIE